MNSSRLSQEILLFNYHTKDVLLRNLDLPKSHHIHLGRAQIVNMSQGTWTLHLLVAS